MGNFGRTLLLTLCHLGPALASTEPAERSLDWAIRDVGTVRVTNPRGAIEVRGWAQDRIRAVWTTTSERPETVKVQVQEVQGRIEVSARYGAGLSVEQKLKERDAPVARADIVVFAPARYPLEILGSDKAITLQGWKASAELRALGGTIKIGALQGKKLSVQCPTCAIELLHVQTKQLSLNGGTGSVQMAESSAKEGFLSTSSGTISVSDSTGALVVSTLSGGVTVKKTRGALEFSSHDGPIDIEEFSGFLSGRSTSGGIRASVKDWVFHDRAFIESDTGDVTLTLPRTFIGEIEAKGGAKFGRAEIVFPLSQMKEKDGRLTGIVKQAFELLSVTSHEGKVSILRQGG